MTKLSELPDESTYDRQLLHSTNFFNLSPCSPVAPIFPRLKAPMTLDQIDHGSNPRNHVILPRSHRTETHELHPARSPEQPFPSFLSLKPNPVPDPPPQPSFPAGPPEPFPWRGVRAEL